MLDRVEELVHESPKAADELAALVEAAAVQYPDLLARSRYLRARVLTERGELDAALGLIEQARAGWWSAGSLLRALRTDLGRMQVLDDLGRHREAAAVGMELLAALEGVPPAPDDDPELRRWLSAATWDNIGVATGFLGEHERAISAFERSEEVYRSLGMPDEVARPMANRGVELLRLGRAREARAVLGVAAEAFAAAGDRLWSAKCFAYLAQAHQQLGELVQALRALESTRVTMDELGADAEAARTRLAIAAAYLEVGLPAEARAEAEAAAEITIAAGMRRDTATARFTVALADLAEGRLEAAAAALAESAALFERSGARAELARVALAEAEVALAGGHRAEAERRAAAAAEELAAGGWLVPLAEARLRQADIAARRAADIAAGDAVDIAAERAADIPLATPPTSSQAMRPPTSAPRAPTSWPSAAISRQRRRCWSRSARRTSGTATGCGWPAYTADGDGSMRPRRCCGARSTTSSGSAAHCPASPSAQRSERRTSPPTTSSSNCS